MTAHPAVSTGNDMDRAMIHQVHGTAPQRRLAALGDTPSVSATCSHEEVELADPEVVGRNASGWLAGG